MARRLGCLLFGFVFIIIMSLPIFAFVLAAQGELMVGDERGSNVRVFMVNADEAEGIGIQRVRKLSTVDGCMQGSVRYLLWKGQGSELSAEYCSCYTIQTGYTTTAGLCQAR